MSVKSNPSTVKLAGELKRISRENKAPIWKSVAGMLEKPARHWAEVNVGKLEDYVKEHSIVIVPGKLLGDGELKKKLTVTAFRFSLPAKKKIIGAGGTVMSLPELVEKHPKGSGVLIIR
jgi:large subunit ribosomal protein L18e